MAVWLIPRLSPLKPRFDPTLGLVSFVMDNLALGQVLHRIIRFSSANIIQQMLRNDVCSHAALA